MINGYKQDALIMGQACFSMDQTNLCNLGRGSLKDHLFQIGSVVYLIDWLQSLKQFFINVSFHILIGSLTLMALF